MANLAELAANPDSLASTLGEASGLSVYPESISVSSSGMVLAMARKGVEKHLLVLGSKEDVSRDFSGEEKTLDLAQEQTAVKICPLSHQNALALHRHLPFTKPVVLGLKKSFGAGDRLGLATPGHVQAVRLSSMKPIFCQQSIREMTRTKRSPQEVMDDATWGVLQAGWQDGYGADADHLKTTEDIDCCFEVGFTFYTIDPGDHVDSSADTADEKDLNEKFDNLPWSELDTNPEHTIKAYGEKTISLDTTAGPFNLSISTTEVQRAAVKYGRAVAHIHRMYQHLESRFGENSFEVEVSVDETDTPTTIAEHYIIASELTRLGVHWISLAPRFVGEFEKGVDYIGDLDQFASELAKHVAISKLFGPYKISLHSGSDKFSIYPIAAELCGELVHLKTAGTSYLEALRAIASVDPELFREILGFARERYPEDRATYHVSAVVDKVARPEDLSDEQLPHVLDQFDTREAVHVTFGSVLNDPRFRERFFATLKENEEVYYQVLEKHIGLHVIPFK